MSVGMIRHTQLIQMRLNKLHGNKVGNRINFQGKRISDECISRKKFLVKLCDKLGFDSEKKFLRSSCEEEREKVFLHRARQKPHIVRWRVTRNHMIKVYFSRNLFEE